MLWQQLVALNTERGLSAPEMKPITLWKADLDAEERIKNGERCFGQEQKRRLPDQRPPVWLITMASLHSKRASRLGPATYDTIGSGYLSHRRPDPRIAEQIWHPLAGAHSILDVGAGTGSYEPRDRPVVALDPSWVMIAQRGGMGPSVVQGVAEALPFAAHTFEAAMAILTVHHWPDPFQGLRELTRVADRVVVLSFDVRIHASFWLFSDYLPEARSLSSSNPMAIEAIAEAISADRVEAVPVPADCQDGFGWAYWCRPEAYLNPAVRACISSVAELPEQLVVRRMEQLRRDLADGTWDRRHGDLRTLDEIDGGFRLVVRQARRGQLH